MCLLLAASRLRLDIGSTCLHRRLCLITDGDSSLSRSMAVLLHVQGQEPERGWE